MLDKLKIQTILLKSMQMGNKLKKFFTYIKDFIEQNWPIFKNNIIKTYQLIMKKGHENLTVMLIPHSEKKIITLHISNFTLLFAILIIVSVIFISSLNIVSTTTTKQEVSNLILSTKNWKIKEKLLRKEIDTISETMEKLKPEIEKLYSSTAFSKENQINLFALGGSSDINEINDENLPAKLPDEFYDLKQTITDMELSKKYIEQVHNFFKERENLFSKLPSIWPLKVGGYITSEYGWRKHPFLKRKTEWHKGIDIASWPGAPVIATAEGNVIHAGWESGYGLVIIIQHEYGFQTRYAHLSRIKAYSGKRVKRGDIIGFLGKTGATTGYHLHYEVRIGLKDINPYPYIMNIK